LPQGSGRSRGAVVVEFALVLPILVALLLGVTTAGLAYNKKLNMTYATREGARFGATVPPSQTWTSGTWASNVRDLVVARSGGDLTTADVCVSLVVSSSATTSAVYSPSASFTTKGDGTACLNDTYPQFSVSDNGLRVQVTSTSLARIELAVWKPVDAILTAKATARSETTG
jgi:Flp pilus assembly protein TadG